MMQSKTEDSQQKEATSSNSNVLNDTIDGGHDQLKDILGAYVNNPDDDESDDDSGIHSLNGKLDLSLLKSPTMPKLKKSTTTPQEGLNGNPEVIKEEHQGQEEEEKDLKDSDEEEKAE